MPKAPMHGAKAIARELRSRGVEYVFGIPGKEALRLCLELEQLGVKFIAARHETQAVMMADGYYRASGKLGIALIAQGAGLANALGGMACAARARSGVVVICGDLLRSSGASDPRAKALQDLKGVDPIVVCDGVHIAHVRPVSASTLVRDVRGALDRAAAGEAIALIVPSDLFAAAVDEDSTSTRATSDDSVDDEAVATTAELLTSFSGRRPVIIAGRGAVRGGAIAVLRQLAERTGALLATTLPARSAFAPDPYNIGVCGTFATPVAAELLREVDTVLAFGASLNPFTTYGGTIFPKKAQLVHIDRDPASIGRHIDASLAVHADARAFARRLVRELELRSYQNTGFRTPGVAARIAEYDPRGGFVDHSRDGYIDPRTLMIELNEMLPRSRALAVDAGLHLHYACMYLDVQRPDDFVFPIDSLAVGLGIGAAIGAAFARPDRTTVLEVGDAGLLMALGDFETAVRYSLPLIVVVSNDQAWGAEAQHLRALGESESFVRYTTPSLAALATAMGGEGYTVTSREDLRALAPKLGERPPVPLLLDCRVHPDIQPESFNFDYAGVFAK